MCGVPVPFIFILMSIFFGFLPIMMVFVLFILTSAPILVHYFLLKYVACKVIRNLDFVYLRFFRARQHLRSLAPIMNEYGWFWWPNHIREPWGLKLPGICLTGEEKPRKNLTQETCPERGSNPGPLRDRRACYNLSHSGGQETLMSFDSRNLELSTNYEKRTITKCHLFDCNYLSTLIQPSKGLHTRIIY